MDKCDFLLRFSFLFIWVTRLLDPWFFLSGFSPLALMLSQICQSLSLLGPG